jgi:hypothetical protein
VYTDKVAAAMLKLHCWSGSMWVMFPIDALIGAGSHIIEVDGRSLVDIDGFSADDETQRAIAPILTQAKRR